MNDYNFFVEFTTNGLVELKDGLKDLNNKFDSLGTSLGNASIKGDSFASKIGGWTSKLIAMSGIVATVGKAIKDAFDVNNQIINLNLVADAAGTTAEEVEALSIALKPFSNGGDTIGIAGQFYQTMLNTKTDMWRNKYSDSVIEEMARAGIYIDRTATPEQYMKALSQALTYYSNKGDEYSLGSRKKLADAFGLDQSMMLLLSSGWENVQNMLEYGKEHSYMSGEQRLKEAQELRKATNELKEAWNRMVVELTPQITEIVKSMERIFTELAPVLNAIVDALSWLLEKYAGLIEKTTGWSGKQGENIANWWSDRKRRNAFSEVLKFARMEDGDWQNVSLEDLNKIMGPAQAFLQENPEIKLDDETEKLYNIAKERWGKTLRANASAYLAGVNSNVNNNNNTATVNIENQNIYTDTERAGRDVAGATQQELNNLQFNSANLATVGM